MDRSLRVVAFPRLGDILLILDFAFPQLVMLLFFPAGRLHCFFDLVDVHLSGAGIPLLDAYSRPFSGP